MWLQHNAGLAHLVLFAIRFHQFLFPNAQQVMFAHHPACPSRQGSAQEAKFVKVRRLQQEFPRSLPCVLRFVLMEHIVLTGLSQPKFVMAHLDIPNHVYREHFVAKEQSRPWVLNRVSHHFIAH